MIKEVRPCSLTLKYLHYIEKQRLEDISVKVTNSQSSGSVYLENLLHLVFTSLDKISKSALKNLDILPKHQDFFQNLKGLELWGFYSFMFVVAGTEMQMSFWLGP